MSLSTKKRSFVWHAVHMTELFLGQKVAACTPENTVIETSYTISLVAKYISHASGNRFTSSKFKCIYKDTRINWPRSH
jgi:hypothetical protein